MESNERMEEVTRENAIIIWQASRLSIGMKCEKAPEILKANGTVVGTLGNFSASIGKAKSKKTFNVSAIVAAALKNGTVLLYSAELPKDKRKILYVDTEQSPYHCLKVMERILRMAGLPTDRDSEHLGFLVLRGLWPWNGWCSSMGTYWAVPYTSLVEVTITRWVPSSRAAFSTFRVPLMLVST